MVVESADRRGIVDCVVIGRRTTGDGCVLTFVEYRRLGDGDSATYPHERCRIVMS